LDNDPLANCVPIEASGKVVKALSELGAEGIAALPSVDQLPQPVPMEILKHHKHASTFLQLRQHLLHEMAECGDNTLATSNQNILQTISQVVELELGELRKDIGRLQTSGASVRESSSGATGAAARKRGRSSDVPRGFVCPITLAVMTNPVIAADGHSYEQRALEEWFKSHNTSPITNLPLAHKLLVPNHALKSSIDDYLEGTPATGAQARRVKH
jgi:hypothetical protein